MRDNELRSLRKVIRQYVREDAYASQRRIAVEALWPQLAEALDALVFDANDLDHDDLIVRRVVECYVAEGNTVHVNPPLMPRETRPDTHPGSQTRSGWAPGTDAGNGRWAGPLPVWPGQRDSKESRAEVPDEDYDAPSDLGNER